MQTQTTRSQMKSNRAILDKHCKTCAECHKPMDETHTSLESYQLHSPSSSKATASANPEKATHSLSSSKIPICLDKNEQTTNSNTMIPAEKVNSLAVSVPSNTEDRLEQCTGIVVIDSSNDEGEPTNNYCENLQQKKPNKKSTTYRKYKDFSDQEYVDSDTDTEPSLIKEGRTKYNMRAPSANYLIEYVEHRTQRGVRLLVPDPSEEDENYHSTRKELCQEKSSSKSKHTLHINDSKDHSDKLSNSDTEVITPPFSPTKKSSASATLSLSRAHKKPLQMIGPSNTTPSCVKLDATSHSARNPEKRYPNSPCSQELPLSPPNTVFDMDHTMVQSSTSASIPKIRIRLSPTGTPEKTYIPEDQEPDITARSSKTSAKINLAAVSSKRRLAPKQKSHVTPRVKLNHCPTESSLKKPLPANQRPSTTPRPGKPPPKPKTPTAWKPLNITQEPSPAQPKRRTSVTRRARAEPYAAATHQRRSSDNLTQETHVSSQKNDSGHLSSQRRRSSRNNRGKNSTASKTEPALSPVIHEVITISSDEPSEPIVKLKKRAPKRKSSISIEPILLGSGQSQETDDSIVEPRSKIRKKALSLKMNTKTSSFNVLKRKNSCLIDPVNVSCRKTVKRIPPPENCASSSVTAADKRILRKRTSHTYKIAFTLEEKETVALEADEEASASEEENYVDDEADDDGENKGKTVVAAKNHKEDGFVSSLQMIKEDPVVGSFSLNKNDLAVSERVLGDGQIGAVYAGTYDGAPVACKTMNKGVDEENFYFQVFKEITFAHKLGHCRNMIKYYGWAHYEGDGSSEEKFYLAQRRIDNGDARKYLFKRRTFSPDEVLHAATCLFSALSDAHAADIGMVDLKLENYLIDNSGSGYLTDFGSCVEFYGRDSVNLLDEEVTWTKSVAAPEMVRSKEFSKASDVFMGTLMLAELTTGLLSDSDFRTKVLRRKAGGAVDFTSKAINPCYSFLFSLLAEGLDTEASNRPTANEMLIKLVKLKKERLTEA